MSKLSKININQPIYYNLLHNLNRLKTEGGVQHTRRTQDGKIVSVAQHFVAHHDSMLIALPHIRQHRKNEGGGHLAMYDFLLSDGNRHGICIHRIDVFIR